VELASLLILLLLLLAKGMARIKKLGIRLQPHLLRLSAHSDFQKSR